MSSKSITSFFKASKASIEPSANLCGVKRSREEASAIETREQGKEEPCVERDILPVPVSWLPLSHLDKSWRDILQEEFNKSYFKELTKFVDSERSSKVIYPPVEKMFNAFNICPYESVKVVIIGQDPYHGPSQAHGLAFSVEKGVPPPPSLKNIFKEAQVIICCIHMYLTCTSIEIILIFRVMLIFERPLMEILKIGENKESCC